MKISARAALAIYKRIKGGRATVMGEARRLGVYHATLRKAMRAAVGAQEYDMLFYTPRARRSATTKATAVVQPLSGQIRVRAADEPFTAQEAPPFCDCRGGVKTSTDGNGRAVLWCDECGHTEVVRARPVANSAVAAPSRTRILALTTSELQRVIKRIASGSSVEHEGRTLGMCNHHELRLRIRAVLSQRDYSALLIQSRAARVVAERERGVRGGKVR